MMAQKITFFMLLINAFAWSIVAYFVVRCYGYVRQFIKQQLLLTSKVKEESGIAFSTGFARPELQIDDAEFRRGWQMENTIMGRALGYPECCIKEFCDKTPDDLSGEVSEDDKMRMKAAMLNGKFSGFVPCKFHAAEILKGHVTLPDLIVYRAAYLRPFPNEFVH